MVTPKDPGVAGAPDEGMHDGMDQEGHDEQFGHADKGKTIKEEDEDE